MKIAKGLQNTSSLTILNITNNNISEEAADDMAAVLSHNTKLQELYVGENNLQASGAMKIAKGLQNTSSLTILNISNNEEAVDDIAAVLSHNNKLVTLELGNNYLGTLGVKKIVKALQKTTSLN